MAIQSIIRGKPHRATIPKESRPVCKPRKPPAAGGRPEHAGGRPTMHWDGRPTTVTQSKAWDCYTTATEAAITCASNTPEDWDRRVSNRRWAASATAMTALAETINAYSNQRPRPSPSIIKFRGHRLRNTRMGRLVQQPPAEAKANVYEALET